MRVPVDTKNSNLWRKVFEQPLSLTQFVKYSEELTHIADEDNIHLVGFAYTHNPLFNSKRYAYKGLCDGRAWLVRKGKPRFGTNRAIGALEDREFTALNLIYYGKVLVCNWIHPDFKRFTKGGVWFYGGTHGGNAECV